VGTYGEETMLNTKEASHMNGQSSDKKQEIIDKAIEFFSKNGIADTKIEDITKAIGIGKGTLYLYFKGKRDLLFHCIERITTIVIPKEVWLDIREETNFKLRFQKRHIAFLRAYRTFCGILNLVNQSLESNDPVLARKAGDAYRLLAGPLTKDLKWAINHGWVRKEIEAEAIGFIMLAVGEGVGNMLKIDPRYPIEKAAEITWDFMINGIGLSATAGRDEIGSLYWKLKDRNDKEVKLRDICSNGMSFLTGRLGEGELQVPLKNVSSIRLQSADDLLSALVVMKNGKSATLTVNSDTRITGETAFGRYEIFLHQIDCITAVEHVNGQPSDSV
jgi:AcrR family transcriptional regulator